MPCHFGAIIPASPQLPLPGLPFLLPRFPPPSTSLPPACVFPSQSWPTTGDLPEPRTGHSAAVFGDSMLVFGGYCHMGTHRRLYNNLYSLDLKTLVWRQIVVMGPVMPLPRCNHTSMIVEKVCLQ